MSDRFFVDKWLKILIPDYVSQHLKFFEPDGNAKFIIEAENSSDGKYLKPKSVAFCSSMLVVICNKLNGRILFFIIWLIQLLYSLNFDSILIALDTTIVEAA